MNRENWTGFKFRNRRDKGSAGNRTILTPVFTALTVAVLKDLTSSDSKILRIARNIFPVGIIGNRKEKKQILNAEFNVLEEETPVEK